jgi:hypothetical protein
MIHAFWFVWRVRHSSTANSPIVRSHFSLYFRRFCDVSLSQVGRALVRLTQVVCEQHAAPFRSDVMSWGVTAVADARMTPLEFGDFKSEEREKTEKAAIKYISEPSVSRQDGLSSFGIAATVAAPGTGKTRLLDDLLRANVPTTHYVLRLPITFNGENTGEFTHPVAVRALLQFVCGTTRVTAKRQLRTLDGHLRSVCGSLHVELFALDVLDAVEAVYFDLRGGVLGRSVLLIDEIKLASYDPPRVNSELPVYRCVTTWIDAGSATADGGRTPSRRGAVFTGVSVLSPFALESSTGRPIVPLPLGIFDVYDDSVRAVIESQAGCTIHPAGGVARCHGWPPARYSGHSCETGGRWRRRDERTRSFVAHSLRCRW